MLREKLQAKTLPDLLQALHRRYPRLTQGQLADLAGCRRETASRVLGRAKETAPQGEG